MVDIWYMDGSGVENIPIRCAYIPFLCNYENANKICR